MLRWYLVLIVALSLACNPASSNDAPSSGKLNIVATTGMVADVVRAVGGEHVEVTQLMAAGVDPHSYSLGREDRDLLLGSDMIFYSGLLLEGKMTDALVKIARSKPVVAVTQEIDESLLLEPDDAPDHHDPHVWMDAIAWSKCAEVVASELGEFLPQHRNELNTAAAAYRTELEILHAYCQSTIATIPKGQRVLITSHDAFNYLGRAYSLEVLGVQGISTESEAGLQRINALVDLLVEREVAAVFVESSVSPKSIEALIEGAASRGHTVRIGGELFSDAMGPAGTYEGTYIGMIDHNVTTITRALGGDAPEGGMQDKLSRNDAEE